MKSLSLKSATAKSANRPAPTRARVVPTKLMQFLEENTKPRYEAKTLAQRIGVSPSLVSLWRIGARKPSSRNLKRLSEVTGIAVEDLL